MNTEVRLGLVGAGRWGRNYIRTIAALPGMRMARLASRNPGSADLAPADCSIFADWREMLDPSALDGVIVATPPNTHAEIALQAISSGLPLLIEKPFTMNLAQAQLVRDQALERGVLVMVDHLHLFSPAYRALKSLRAACGQIRTIRTEAGNHGPYRPDAPVLWDWGAHDVAMCLDLLGTTPNHFKATVMERQVVENGVGETIAIELGFPMGQSAFLRMSNLTDRCRRLEVQCEQASLVYDDVAEHKLVLSRHDGDRSISIVDSKPLGVAVSEFVAAINASSRSGANLDLAVSVVAVLADCAEAEAFSTAR